MGFIYKITSPSNKIYIGQTNDLRKRINCHKHSMKRNGSKVILINSFKKYGFDEHLFEIVEECDDSILDEREIFWIKEYNSFYANNLMGMNMTTGGEGHTGFNKNDENRKRILLENLYSKGQNPFKGKKHTEENKKKMSKLMSERNKKMGIAIPYWGAVKGWEACMKDVVVYGKNGNRLGEFKSITAAAKFFGFKGSLFSDSILKDRWVNGEYKVFYKKENMPEVIPTDDIRFYSVRKEVLAFDRNMIFLGEFEYAEEAAKVLGVPATTIKRAAKYNNLHPIRKGFIFAYKEDCRPLRPSEMEGGVNKNKPLILKQKNKTKWQDQKAELH